MYLKTGVPDVNRNQEQNYIFFIHMPFNNHRTQIIISKLVLIF